MRRVLVDHARDRKRLKRGGPARRRADLDLDALTRSDASPDDLLDLDAALSLLEREDPRNGAPRIPEALDRLIDLYTAMSRPDEVKKWRTERAKYPPANPPRNDPK